MKSRKRWIWNPKSWHREVFVFWIFHTKVLTSPTPFQTVDKNTPWQQRNAKIFQVNTPSMASYAAAKRSAINACCSGTVLATRESKAMGFTRDVPIESNWFQAVLNLWRSASISSFCDITLLLLRASTRQATIAVLSSAVKNNLFEPTSSGTWPQAMPFIPHAPECWLALPLESRQPTQVVWYEGGLGPVTSSWIK